MIRTIASRAIAATALIVPMLGVGAQTGASPVFLALPPYAAPDSSEAGPSAFDAAPMEDAALGRIAGREDLNQVAQSSNVSTVAGNSVGDNARTGDASIADNAFQNLSGLSLLNVNTGNNVAINSAMNVTIAISPAP